jgi:non-heme chloroperoxidase
VRLRYVDRGIGQALVLVHGLSQTAAQFRRQIDDLDSSYRVIAPDLRGHGESDKPDHGYRIARLAQDLRELMLTLDLHDVLLLGHSMGCSVLWSYWDMFGADRVAKLVLVDQPPTMVSDPAQPVPFDTIYTPQEVFDDIAALVAPDGAEVTASRIREAGLMVGSRHDREFFVECNLKLPRRHAATLLLDHAFHDWRDVLPLITVPTLVIGGTMMTQSIKWLASQIPSSTLTIFSAEDHGGHFMFWENPTKFNAVVRAFLAT